MGIFKNIKNKFIYVYIINNSINNKRYIGVHTTNNINDGYMGGGTAIKRAQKKYGISNFKKEILIFCDNVFDAYKKESEFIVSYNTLRPNGYNISPSGEPAQPNGISKETRKKMSTAQKRIQNSPKMKNFKSKMMKEKWKDEKYRERVIQKRKETYTEEMAINKSNRMKEWWAVGENREKAVSACREEREKNPRKKLNRECPYCHKIFSIPYNMRKHKNICKEKPVWDYNECLWGHISQLKHVI